MTFIVYGLAQPKGSMRAFMPRGMKVPIITDSNLKAKSWAQLVAHTASDELARTPGAEVLDGPIRLVVAFYLPRPKRFLIDKWRRQQPSHQTAPDLDKLVRGVMDALTCVLYRDDAQIVEVHAAKHYTEPDHPPQAHIRVEPQPAAAVASVFE